MITTLEVPEPVIDPSRRFYVSVIDNNRFSLLLGPFELHSDALSRVDAIRRLCYDLDCRSPWYRFGTASLTVEDAQKVEGRLNCDERFHGLLLDDWENVRVGQIETANSDSSTIDVDYLNSL